MTRIIQYGNETYNADGSYTFTLDESSDSTENSDIEHTLTALTLIPITEESNENLSELIDELKNQKKARSGGSNTIYDSDTAGCVSAYLTINYKNVTSNNKEYVSLTSVSGGYSAEGSGSIISSGVTVNSQSVTYGMTGVGTGGTTLTQRNTYNPEKSSRSFSITVPSTWKPVAAESNVTTVGANYTITLKRGTGTWNCYI